MSLSQGQNLAILCEHPPFLIRFLSTAPDRISSSVYPNFLLPFMITDVRQSRPVSQCLVPTKRYHSQSHSIKIERDIFELMRWVIRSPRPIKLVSDITVFIPHLSKEDFFSFDIFHLSLSYRFAIEVLLLFFS